MRFRSHPLTFVLAAALLAAPALTAQAAGLYKWETESGAVAFTDDPKRIPARYRDQAVAVETRRLADYARFTEVASPVETAQAPAPSHAERVEDRLTHLRALNDRTVSPDAVRAPGAERPLGLTVRSTRQGEQVAAELDRRGGAPVIVEKIRTRPPGSPVTRHVTVVRQGDEVLSIIKPRSLHGDVRPIDERELLE